VGHFCRICGRVRANEQFSGKGHRIHVCKHCQRLPKTQRRAIEDRDDIFGFMQQSHRLCRRALSPLGEQGNAAFFLHTRIRFLFALDLVSLYTRAYGSVLQMQAPHSDLKYHLV